MISRADEALCDREPALPGLRTLLDDEAFAALVRKQLPGHRIGAARATYVRHKPGTGTLVAYELDVDGTVHPVYARAVTRSPGPLAKLQKAREEGPSPLGRGALVVESPAIGIYAQSSDRRLSGLHRLVDEEARRRLLRRSLPDSPGVWDARLEPLRWKPERRFVARLRAPAGHDDAVVKVHLRNGFERALAGATAVRPAAALRVPELLGRSRRHRMVALEWVEGNHLDRVAASAAFDPEGAAVAGAALAELQSQPAGDLPTLTLAAEVARLRSAAAAAAVAGRAAGREARRLTARLGPVLAAHRSRTVPVHGDFSIDQIVLAGGAAVVLDLDEAAVGGSSYDLASLLADLEVRVLAGELERERAEALSAAVVEGYRDRAGRSTTRSELSPAIAAAMVRRASEPFRLRLPAWDERVTATLARAAELAAVPEPRAFAAPTSRRRYRQEADVPTAAPARRGSVGDPAYRRGRPPASSLTQSLRSVELEEDRASRLGTDAGELGLERAWPRGEGRLLLEYRDTAGRVIAGQWLDPSGTEYEAANDGATAGASDAVPLVAAGGLALMLHPHGADPRLPGLRAAAERPRARVLGHRAGRRAVVRVDASGGTRFVKIVRPRRVRGVIDLAVAAQGLAGGAFAVPVPVAADLRSGVVECPTLDGRSLTEILAGPRSEAASAAERAGHALGTLHRGAPPAELAEHTEQDEARVLAGWARATRVLEPELGERVVPVADRIAAALDRLAGPRRAIHRDLHDGQFLIGEGMPALLDFDTLAVGDPALDLGNLLVHLELRTLQGACPRPVAAEAAHALLAGYRPDQELLARAAPYADAARARLACVYAFRPAWQHLSGLLLELVGRGLPGLDESPLTPPAPGPRAATHIPA